MGSTKSSSRFGLGKKVLSCGAAVAVGACMLPSAAFGAVNYNESGVPTYKLPTHAMAVESTLTDASGNEYTQHYIASAGGRWSKASYSILGINNVIGESNGGTGTNVDGTTTSTEYGLYASDANQMPDALMYNMCAYNNGVAVPADVQAQQQSTVSVSIDGTAYNMPREVYCETDIIQTSASTDTSGEHTWAEWVALENQREGRSRTQTYDPTFQQLAVTSGGTYTVTAGEWKTAEVCDTVIAESKDKNGNYTKATRYAQGPETWKSAANFEDIAKGLQYYVLSQIAQGTVKKGTVAVVCGFDTDTHNYAVRILNTGVENDKDANVYAGRIANAVNPIATDMTTLDLKTAQDAYIGEITDRSGNKTTRDESGYVKWYTAEQIVQNCDAAFICDAPGSNSVSSYLATGTEGYANTVFTDDNIQYLTKAQSDARAAGNKAADICVNWPGIQFNCFYAQGNENLMMNFITACFLYPEILDLTDCMAWWASNVWHITDASLQDMVDSTCYKVSLSTNQTKIGTISADYKTTVDEMITEGNAYYLANTEELDAIADGNIKTYNLDNLKARTIVSANTAKASYAYTGKAITPAIIVKDGNGTLTEGVDYTVEYKNNVKVGTATAIITGLGNHIRQATVNFTITNPAAKAQTIKVKVAKKTYKAAKKGKYKGKLAKGKSFKIGAKAQTKLTYKVTKKASKKISVSKTGKVTLKKGAKKGTYRVTVYAAATKAYKAAKKVITIKVK